MFVRSVLLLLLLLMFTVVIVDAYCGYCLESCAVCQLLLLLLMFTVIVVAFIVIVMCFVPVAIGCYVLLLLT